MMSERGISRIKSAKDGPHAARDPELARKDAYERMRNWK